MGLCLTQNSTHLHHPLKAPQQGVLGFTFTYGNFQCHNTPTHSSNIHSPPRPIYALKVNLALSVQSDCIVALTTIHRSTFTGLERNFGILTALGTYGGEHLASRPVAGAIVSITLCLPRLTAWKTALWLIGIAFGRKKFLFLSAESEGSPTIGTLD